MNNYNYKKNNNSISINFSKDILINEEELLELINVYIINKDIICFIIDIIIYFNNYNVDLLKIHIKNKTDNYYFVFSKNNLLKYSYRKQFSDNAFKLRYNNVLKKIDYNLEKKTNNNSNYNCNDILTNNFIIINSLKEINFIQNNNLKIKSKKHL